MLKPVILSQPIFWIKNLRALATVAVIFLHVSSPILTEYGQIPMGLWWIGNFVDGISRFCVPLFFMISGALLLGRASSKKLFLKKRFFRIIPPLVFWSLIYTLYKVFITNSSDLSTFEIIKKIIRDLINGSQYHLWFVYTLIGLYFFIPVLGKWVCIATKKDIQYFLLIWVVTLLYYVPSINAYLPKISLVNFSGYLGYMVLGYYLARWEFPYKSRAFLLFLGGTGITVIGTYILTEHHQEFYGYLYQFLTVNVLFSSVGIFLFIKNISHLNHRNRFINIINDYSYGIFLVHVLILFVFSEFGINWKSIHPIISIPVISIGCLITSITILSLLRRIKFGKFVSG